MPQHFQRTEAGLLHLVVVISLTDTELDTQRCLCWSQPAFTLSSTKAREQTLKSAGPPERHTHSLLRFSKTEHWVCGKLWLPLFAAPAAPLFVVPSKHHKALLLGMPTAQRPFSPTRDVLPLTLPDPGAPEHLLLPSPGAATQLRAQGSCLTRMLSLINSTPL